jgi:large subunit ribosomal protein L18Ae
MRSTGRRYADFRIILLVAHALSPRASVLLPSRILFVLISNASQATMPHMTRGGCKLYQVVGRKAPTESEPEPPAFRMKLFAPNEVVAKSRFWYFLHQFRNMKKTTGEILDVNEIREVNPTVVKNYALWIRYDSRSGTHNMYREYRALKLNDAVNAMYSEMAGRHRARPRSIQIIRTAIIDSKDVKRVNMMQFVDATPEGEFKDVKFALPHRIQRAPTKSMRTTFKASRPQTHFN